MGAGFASPPPVAASTVADAIDPLAGLTDQRMPVLVMGIGNLLWADEGFGVRCAEVLARDYGIPDQVTVMDGGTQGLNLVDPVRRADRLIIFDAISFGGEPGDLVTARDSDVPRFIGARAMSLHQTGFEDVLSCADLLGGLPQDILLIGCEPLHLEDYGGSLTDPVRAQVDAAVAMAVKQLTDWGFSLAGATTPGDDPLTGALVADRYEAERPDEAAAWRHGDARVLNCLGPAAVEGAH